MSRNGVALAADSAFTRGNKVGTGNKLFSLSPSNDIGVMIFGSADFLGYPWEILIKSFRRKIGNNEFASVKECAAEFVAYMRDGDFGNSQAQQLSIQLVILDALEMVKDQREKDVSAATISSETFKTIRKITKSLDSHFELIGDHCSFDEFKEDFESDCLDLACDVLQVDCAERPRNKATLLNFLYKIYQMRLESTYSTGIVFVGYGKDQFFPELVSYNVDGRHKNYYRIWPLRSNDLNEEGNSGAVIMPFAQSDMFQVFMEGIARNHLEFVDETLKQLLKSKSTALVKAYVKDPDERKVELVLQETENKTILKEFHKEFRAHIHGTMVKPVMEVLEGLPKEELAAMAEALVEITSLRRKVDSHIESVGGPTDVALISKGDGIVWIKRKHYFMAELNQDFTQRKRKRHGGDDENA